MRSRYTLAAILLASAVFSGDRAASSEPVASAQAGAARTFLDSLDEADRALAQRAFEDPARLDWHNIPKPQRKGLPFRDMTPRQKELCLALLRAALSESGYEKALRVMALENNLREGEKERSGAPLRDPERYYLTIFGQPSDQGAWGWSFEGHHLSLNFTVRDGEVASATPSFWGANPATVHVEVDGGPARGVRTLAQEEQIALDLVASLDDAQRRRAMIAEQAPAEYRAAGEPRPPQTPPEGIPAAQLTGDQRRQLVLLLRTYVEHLAPPLAAAQMRAIEAAGLERVCFAWAGATQPGRGHYYRVQGPTFVLELINVQSDPAGNPANHIHSVWRTLPDDFGIASP